MGVFAVTPQLNRLLRIESWQQRNFYFFRTYDNPSNGARGEEFMEEVPPILVVEDDFLVQAMIKDALAEAGFEVAAISDGEQALSLLKDGKAAYRALVTDINGLGAIDGWHLARRAREIDPGFPVIYLTAAAAGEWAANGVPNSVLIAKPFAPAQIVTAVAQLLNTGSPPPAPA
jgi:DNA-binding response OmpR family regulator